MKKILISSIIVTTIIVLAYIFKDIVAIESKADNGRFIKIDTYNYGYIIYDKQTKVEYAVSDGAYNRGTITLLVDHEGKPLLYKETE